MWEAVVNKEDVLAMKNMQMPVLHKYLKWSKKVNLYFLPMYYLEGGTKWKING